MVVFLVLVLKLGEIVVDLVVVFGGKMVYMVELMENRGKIYVFDVDSVRIKCMKEVFKRIGVEIVEVIKVDGRNVLELFGEEIVDRVFFDVLCISDGIIVKNFELRWCFREKNIFKVVVF